MDHRLDNGSCMSGDAHVQFCEKLVGKFHRLTHLIILAESESDAERVLKALRNRFAKYKLQLHPDKTNVYSFGKNEKENSVKDNRKANTFDFLGFTHYCDKTRKGHFKVGRKTSAKKFRAKAREINLWLKSIRNLVLTKDWWKILSAKLRGHYEYYGI